eukprot:1054729_1
MAALVNLLTTICSTELGIAMINQHPNLLKVMQNGDKTTKKKRSRKQQKTPIDKTAPTYITNTIIIQNGASPNDTATTHHEDQKDASPRDNNITERSAPQLQHQNDANSAPSRVHHEARVDKSNELPSTRHPVAPDHDTNKRQSIEEPEKRATPAPRNNDNSFNQGHDDHKHDSSGGMSLKQIPRLLSNIKRIVNAPDVLNGNGVGLANGIDALCKVLNTADSIATFLATGQGIPMLLGILAVAAGSALVLAALGSLLTALCSSKEGRDIVHQNPKLLKVLQDSNKSKRKAPSKDKAVKKDTPKKQKKDKKSTAAPIMHQTNITNKTVNQNDPSPKSNTTRDNDSTPHTKREGPPREPQHHETRVDKSNELMNPVIVASNHDNTNKRQQSNKEPDKRATPAPHKARDKPVKQEPPIQQFSKPPSSNHNDKPPPMGANPSPRGKKYDRLRTDDNHRHGNNSDPRKRDDEPHDDDTRKRHGGDEPHQHGKTEKQSNDESHEDDKPKTHRDDEPHAPRKRDDQPRKRNSDESHEDGKKERKSDEEHHAPRKRDDEPHEDSKTERKSDDEPHEDG